MRLPRPLIAGLFALCVPALAACATTPAHGSGPDAASAAAPALVPPPPAWLDALERMYPEAIRVGGLEQRTFAPEHWWQVATPLLSV